MNSCGCLSAQHRLRIRRTNRDAAQTMLFIGPLAIPEGLIDVDTAGKLHHAAVPRGLPYLLLLPPFHA